MELHLKGKASGREYEQDFKSYIGFLHWAEELDPKEIEAFHHYLTEREYRKRIDFSDSETSRLWEYDEDKVSKLIARMPMTKWSESSKGLITFVDDVFTIQMNVPQEDRVLLHQWTKEICLYRLHVHFERRDK